MGNSANISFAVCPLQDWERAGHGTGMGFSTVKAFWLPEKAVEVEALPSAKHGGSSLPRGNGQGGSKPTGNGKRKQGRSQRQDQDGQPREPPPVSILLAIQHNFKHKLWDVKMKLAEVL